MEAVFGNGDWQARFARLRVYYLKCRRGRGYRGRIVVDFDPDAARADPENAAVLAADSARTVIGELAARLRAHSGKLTAEAFQTWLNEIGTAANVTGPELMEPVRIALTGRNSGPDFDELIPLIEDGAAQGLCPSTRERIERFVGV